MAVYGVDLAAPNEPAATNDCKNIYKVAGCFGSSFGTLYFPNSDAFTYFLSTLLKKGDEVMVGESFMGAHPDDVLDARDILARKFARRTALAGESLSLSTSNNAKYFSYSLDLSREYPPVSAAENSEIALTQSLSGINGATAPVEAGAPIHQPLAAITEDNNLSLTRSNSGLSLERRCEMISDGIFGSILPALDYLIPL